MQEEWRAQEMSYLGREPRGCANIRCASSTIVQLLIYTLIHGVTLYLLYVDIGYMFVCIIYWVYYILLDIDTHCCWIYIFCERPLGGQITQRASQLQSMGRNLAKRIPSDCSECPIANCRREYSRCSTGIFPYNASTPCRSHAEHICLVWDLIGNMTLRFIFLSGRLYLTLSF